jgi:hypothetical protein
LPLWGSMRGRNQYALTAALYLLALVLGNSAMGQVSASASTQPAVQSSSASAESPGKPVEIGAGSQLLTSSPVNAAPQALFAGEESNLKFNVNTLMRTLSDSRHEGWVLAAYPDPKTSGPLIGAGFSLDVAATDHLQHDAYNPHQFVEPSSAQLWQAAGLDPERLQSILAQFDRDLAAWSKKKYRKRIKAHALAPEVSEEEANSLLRVSTVQAIHNARAYCRSFDQLNGAQQMALSQLVFQMGVNLEEFTQFLSAINDDVRLQDASLSASAQSDREHWEMVQRTLIESQWAKRYTSRAVTVIAMFDPDYLEDPRGAERRVQYAIRPPRKHHHRRSRA